MSHHGWDCHCRGHTRGNKHDVVRIVLAPLSKFLTLGPLNAKVMIISKTNIMLEVTTPLVKEELVQKLGRILAAVNGIMKWKYSNRRGPVMDWCFAN